MFDSLSDRFDGIFKRLRGKGRLTDSDVDEVLREIRMALLEADVNVTVVRNVVARIREQAIGRRPRQGLTPGQQVIKIVNEELVTALGGETLKITYASQPPTVVLMAGLQGSGKTTDVGQARPLVQGARVATRCSSAPTCSARPPSSSCARSAARSTCPCSPSPADPVDASPGGGVAEARRVGRDVVIVDTAGRLAIDAEMMEQVRQISATVQPDYTFLVVDAMTGQDAVSVAEAFNETLAIDGVILSKLDGDARGGAALSVKEVIGRPIAFASTGEKLDDFEQFHPDRMASRILGMGDVLTPHREGRRGLREGRGRGRCGQAARGRVHARRLPRADAAAEEDGAALECDRYDPRASEGSPQRRDPR